MIRARVTLYQKVVISKTVEVEAESYYDLENEAKSEFGMCLIDDYYNFEDYENSDIEVLEEWEDEEEWEEEEEC